MRKREVEQDLQLAPRQRARDELVGVAGDDEMPREITPGNDRCHEEAEDHQPSAAARHLDQPCNRGYGRYGATLVHEPWRRAMSRVQVNSVVHFAGRKRYAGSRANLHSTGCRIRTNASANAAGSARMTCAGISAAEGRHSEA